jgi:methionyl-tRNA formyltransferase
VVNKKMKMKIVFMGTPEFAVPSLDILVQNNYDVCAVVTATDKPAGRGQKIQYSAVKEYALSKNLNILQPEKLKDENFVQALKDLKADLFIVVAFRMLPEIIWQMPAKGTFNLHASLLPNYRGAAPIHHAVMNGEKETGVSTFFLKHDIDTGDIIFQEKYTIAETANVGEVYNALMHIGAPLVLKTVRAIAANTIHTQAQTDTALRDLKHAPKIFKEDTLLNFNADVKTVYNKVRGLSPFPCSYFKIKKEDKELVVKVYAAEYIINTSITANSKIITDDKSYIHIACENGFINITEIQVEGKKKMKADELLRGFKLSEYSIVM